MLKYSDCADTGMMIKALQMLPEQPLPSAAGTRELLNGLENINHRIAELMLDH
jgi:hypothetical protein